MRKGNAFMPAKNRNRS